MDAVCELKVLHNKIIPFGKLFKADLQFSMMVSMLVWGYVQETLCNMKGSLVDRSGNASLKLHLQ